MPRFRLSAILAAPLLAAAVLLSCSPAAAAGPDFPMVYAVKDSVMLAGPGVPPRELGTGRQPCLSPGGDKAAWVEHGDDPAKARIVVLDLKSGALTELAGTGGYTLSPRWSPDGGAIAYVTRSEGGPSELWTLKPGGKPSLVARSGAASGDDIFEPVWPPDGGHILYHDMRHLYRVKPGGQQAGRTALSEITGGKETSVTSSDRFAPRPGGSGEMLYTIAVPGTKLFQRKVPDLSSAVFLFDPRTGKSRRLTPENVTAFAPAWTPDGGAFVFTGYTDKQAGEAYPFRVWTARPGQPPEELGPGENPMPPSGG